MKIKTCGLRLEVRLDKNMAEPFLHPPFVILHILEVARYSIQCYLSMKLYIYQTRVEDITSLYYNREER